MNGKRCTPFFKQETKLWSVLSGTNDLWASSLLKQRGILQLSIKDAGLDSKSYYKALRLY